MASPIALRGDFDGPGLRRLAKQSKDAAQARRSKSSFRYVDPP